MSGVQGQHRLADKVAVITGGSAGIRAAAARLFAHEGAHVVIAARGAPAGLQVVREVTEAGGSALFVQTDVADSASVAAAIARTYAAAPAAGQDGII